MAVVYQHRRLDTNEIFYIGIGLTISRSESKKNRNIYWHRIVEKYGYDVEVLHTGISWEQSCELEMMYIKKYGRKDLGLGLLVNLTDGGEGMKNFSDITLKKMSDAQKGKKHSVETNSKKGSKGDNNPSKRPEVRKKISIANSNRPINENANKKTSITLSGENGTNSKLKNEDVLFIRKHYIKNHIEYGSKPLSIKYNVCTRTIQSIIQRIRWKYI